MTQDMGSLLRPGIPIGSNQMNTYKRLRSHNDDAKWPRYLLLPCIALANSIGVTHRSAITRCKPISVKKPAAQLAIIQMALCACDCRLLRATSHHAAVNAMLSGMNDSFVSAPSTAMNGRFQSSFSESAHRSASRKNPSPASTSPASLRLGTAKFTRYSNDATRETG